MHLGQIAIQFWHHGYIIVSKLARIWKSLAPISFFLCEGFINKLYQFIVLVTNFYRRTKNLSKLLSALFVQFEKIGIRKILNESLGQVDLANFPFYCVIHIKWSDKQLILLFNTISRHYLFNVTVVHYFQFSILILFFQTLCIFE